MGQKINDLPALTAIAEATDLFEVSQTPHTGATSKKITMRQLADYIDGRFYVKRELTVAEILAIGSTPIILVASVAGKVHAVQDMWCETEKAGTPYITSNVLSLKTDTASVVQYSDTTVLSSTIQRLSLGYSQPIGSFNPADAQLIKSKALTITSANGSDPTGGDFKITVHCIFKMLTPQY